MFSIGYNRDIESLTIKSLMGVDYSGSMLNIEDYHAYDILNLLKKNNVLQKRSGWKQIYDKKVNGIWKCRVSPTQVFYVYHIGNKLYYNASINEDFLNLTLLSEAEFIQDMKSFGVFTNDRLYLLCGSYVVIKFISNGTTFLINEPILVSQDEDTYVPTTTIGMRSGDYNGTTPSVRAQLDRANLLTPYRWNTGSLDYNIVEEGDKGYFYSFELDSGININNVTDTIATLKLKNAETEEFEDVDLEYSSVEELDEIRNYYFVNQNYPDDCKLTIQFYRVRAIKDRNGVIIGLQAPHATKVELWFSTNFMPPNLTLTDTFKIKFKTGKDESSLINNCTMGVLFGAEGNRNRLFITGNPLYPNVDYHTERRNIYATEEDTDLLDSQDLTYFPVDCFCEYGTKNTSITGYQIMGDGSLMVVKETSESEPNIYFRKGVYNTRTINIGNYETTVAYETYPMYSGNIGQGCDYKGAVVNLNNDIIFLSKKGVFGVSASVTVSDLNSDYKYAYARSRLIDNKLCEYLRKATNVTTVLYDNKYFISIKTDKEGEGITFVGDGRHKYVLNDSLTNEFEYEWFVLDYIPDGYILVDGNLYMYVNDGLYLYNDKEDQYFDIIKYKCQNSEILIGENGEITAISNSVYPLEKCYFYNSDDVYQRVSKCVFTSDNVNIDEQARKYIGNKDLLVQLSDSSWLEVKLQEYDGYEEEITYTIVNYDAIVRKLNEVYGEIPTTEFDLCFKVTNDDKFSFSLYRNDGKIFLIDSYSNIANLFNANTPNQFNPYIITYYEMDIYSKYVTKVFNMGNSTHNKILRNITITNDGLGYSSVNMGIKTRNFEAFLENPINVNYHTGFTLNEFNLYNLDLNGKSFPTSFSKNYLLKFNFVQFVFHNHDSKNSIINNLQVLYTYGFKRKGVF